MKILVELDVCDALQAGLTMKSLVAVGYIREPGTAEVYARVGGILTEAARAAASKIGRAA